MTARRGFEVRVARGDEARAVLDDAWDDLLTRTPRPNPTLSSSWLRELLRYETGLPLLVTVAAGGRLACAGAFRLRRVGPARVARPLGSGFSVLGQELLVDPELAGSADALVEALVAEADLLRLDCRRESELAHALRRRLPWAWTEGILEGWTVGLPPPKLDYIRKRVAYERRRAAGMGAIVAVTVASRPDDVAAALERLLMLHRERWQGRTDSLRLFSSTEPQREFHRRAVRALAGGGVVRVFEVRENEQLRSGALLLLGGPAAVYYATATRRNGILREPGHVAMLEVVEAARAAGARVLDLGRGGGAPGGPKHRLGPMEVPYLSFFAARSASLQMGLRAAVRVRRSIRNALPRRAS